MATKRKIISGPAPEQKESVENKKIQGYYRVNIVKILSCQPLY